MFAGMQVTRRNVAVYGLLGLVWALVVLWQVQEHARVRDAARTSLSDRSEDIANTVSACIRGMRFRGTVWQERLEPLLNELVNGRTNELIKSSEVVSLVLVNASGERIGWVTSCAVDAERYLTGQAYLRLDCATENTPILIHQGGVMERPATPAKVVSRFPKG